MRVIERRYARCSARLLCSHYGEVVIQLELEWSTMYHHVVAIVHACSCQQLQPVVQQLNYNGSAVAPRIIMVETPMG